MKLKLFEYAILWHPTVKETQEGLKSKILTPPTVVLSKDEKSVGMQSAMDIPSEFKESLDQIEILVRPF